MVGKNGFGIRGLTKSDSDTNQKKETDTKVISKDASTVVTTNSVTSSSESDSPDPFFDSPLIKSLPLYNTDGTKSSLLELLHFLLLPLSLTLLVPLLDLRLDRLPVNTNNQYYNYQAAQTQADTEVYGGTGETIET